MILGSQLQTSRLIVRPFASADVIPLVQLLGDPRVHRFVGDGRPLEEQDARLWVVRSQENLERYGYGTGAVTHRGVGPVIGWAGFARPGDGTEEVIYGLAADQWGQGLGRELLEGLVRFAASRGMRPIRATVDPRNTASIRLLSRQGFRLADGAHKGSPESALYLRQG